MKNPFWNIKSILILLLIPFSIFLILVSLLLVLFDEKDGYLVSLFLMPLAIALATYSFRYIIKTYKSFKNDLIICMNDDSKLIELFNYEKLEWRNFAERYYHKRVKKYKVTLFTLIAVIISLMIVIYRENYRLFIMLSFILFLVTTFIFVLIRKSLIEFKTKLFDFDNPQAKITIIGILINNSYIVSYNNQDGKLIKCTSSMFLGMKCLEFKIKRIVGKGYNYQYFNLLIPENREQDSLMLESSVNECIV